jgi:hypothetical protein
MGPTVGGLGRAGEWCVGWVGGAYDGMSVSPQRLVQTGRTCGHMTCHQVVHGLGGEMEQV